MSTRPGLERLLRPRSIAVIGGGFWGVNVVEQCRKIGFAGAVWPVHPREREVGGLPAFAGVDDLPEAPDASFIAVNRRTSVDIVRSLGARGAGGAICFASGFREAIGEASDGAGLQDALVAAAGPLRFLGPNCYGFINYLDGAVLWPDQHGGTRPERGVAIICQSSNIAINLTMQTRGLPIAYVVTIGNQAQTGLAEIAETVLHDERVSALGLYLESVGDPRAFEAMTSRAHALGKPIVAMKAGRSEASRLAAISHTASLTGTDAGATALLDRLGVARVSSLAALLETLKLLHVTGPLRSPRIVSLSCSGGEAGLVADSAAGTGLEFPALNMTQKEGLRAALGPMVALANPLDYNTYIWGDLPRMTETYAAMMRADVACGLLVIDFPRADRCDPGAWGPAIDCLIAASRESGAPMAAVATLPETMPEAMAHRLIAEGVVPFCGLAEAMEALDRAAWLGRYQPAEPIAPPEPAAGPARQLTEAEAKAALAEHGLRTPQARRATTPEAAAAVAEALGFPVVLKGEGMAHKTEAGAVVLNLRDAAAVLEAARGMTADAFLVERMVTGTIAELLVGVVRDPAHGLVLTLAAGGVWTEILRDSVVLMVPADRDAVDRALSRLRIGPVLDGYRGAQAVDRDALAAAIDAIQSYAIASGASEVEVNPLLSGADFAIAADALIKFGETS